MRSLVVAALFVVANMVATLGVFVPSASAAPVWEEVVSVANDDKIHVNGFLPFGVMDNSGKLTPYTSFKVEFTYRDESQGAVNSLYMTKVGVDTLYDHIAATKGDVGTYALNTDGAEHTVTSAEFSVGGYPNMRLWLSHGTGNASDYNNPNPYVVITSHKLLGLRDSSIVTPAAPILVSPDDAVDISLDEIYANSDSSDLVYDSADGVQKNHIQVTGVFDRGDATSENKSINKVSEDESFALENFVPQDNSYAYIVGNTYTWQVRSSFNEAVDAETDTGWGDWSASRQFTVTAGSAVPAAPTLVSPENNGEVVYDTIYELDDNKIARFVYKPALGAQNNNIILTGDFGSGVETISRESITGNIELEEFVDEYDFIVGNTYKWQVRSNFVEDVFSHTEEDWGDWSEERSFTVVLAPTAPKTGGDNNPGETPKTTPTPTGNEVRLASNTAVQGGEVLAQQDSTGTLSDSTGEDLDDEEAVEEGDDEEKGEDKPFLLLGWWWLPLLIAAGGGAYYFFKIPSEE